MSNFNTRFIGISFLAGTSIGQAITEAMDLVKGGALRVYFEFNGVKMLITKDSNITDETKFFNKSMEINGIRI